MFTPGRGAQAIHIINANMGNGGVNLAGIPGIGGANGLFGNLINMLSGNLPGGDVYEGGQSLDQIIQQIVANDPNKYGTPPASKDAVAKLPKGKYSEFLSKKNEETKGEKISEDNRKKSEEMDTSCTV